LTLNSLELQSADSQEWLCHLTFSAACQMRVLFDQGTPVGIRDSLPEHIVRTAREQGRSTLLNGELLRAAEKVLLTTDTNLPYQQNLEGRNWRWLS
jgi:hypothetical protein